MSELVALWLDPSVTPEDGDMVAVVYSDKDLHWLIDAGMQIPAWRAVYGGRPFHNLLLKQYLLHAGRKYLATPMTGVLPYGESRVLGVVRFFLEPSEMTPDALLHAYATRRNGVPVGESEQRVRGNLAGLQAMLARATGADSRDSCAETVG